MKSLFACAIFLWATAALSAQNWVGSWQGELQIQGTKLRLVLNFEQAEGKWKGTMDSPDQNAYRIGLDSVSITDKKVYAGLKAANAYFTGEYDAATETIKGEWVQGQRFALDLKKSAEIELPKRPQEPKRPFPYREENVTISNKKSGFTLAGTLTLPKEGTKFPAVVLITGSGGQNRDEEIMGHRPFLLLADYLTRRGFAVLRMDDRGVGESKGKFEGATSADFVTDIQAGVDFLQKDSRIDKKRVGLIGHSEGGMIAPILAAKNKKIAFIVLLAAPGIAISDLMQRQSKDIMLQSGETPEEVEKNIAIISKLYAAIKADKKNKLTESELLFLVKDDVARLEPTDEEMKEMMANIRFVSQDPWFNYFLKFEPADYLTKVRCPVLALQGGKDIQVAAEDNLPAIQTHLEKGKNKNFTCLLLPELNHLFQTCTTCTIPEYGTLEETFAPEALKAIGDWLEKNFK
jgi:dipeptidyl aminopeptidase/acylaminoacyl peptidase